MTTGYSPARLAAVRGTITVRGTVLRWPGLSWGGCGGALTQVSGTPSAVRVKWSTVRPLLLRVTLNTAGCPGVSVIAVRSRATRIRFESPAGGALLASPLKSAGIVG